MAYPTWQPCPSSHIFNTRRRRRRRAWQTTISLWSWSSIFPYIFFLTLHYAEGGTKGGRGGGRNKTSVQTYGTVEEEEEDGGCCFPPLSPLFPLLTMLYVLVLPHGVLSRQEERRGGEQLLSINVPRCCTPEAALVRLMLSLSRCIMS